MWGTQLSVKIDITDAVKRFGNNTIIPGLTVGIEEGEFFTLLGPSGCGKTTLLRMIAGFNTIDGGTFQFGDRTINDLEPSKRNIGMVFQNYAIFPHLTVEKNVAYGLKNRKMPKDHIKTETRKFLELMQIEKYKDRLPEKLSGGQQQRVALARALVIQPDVLLMDEPLSNLDAKLRIEMRAAIKEIQHRFEITTVYVTHDQEEAMAISDRIAVMHEGSIQHIGTPREIYQRPNNLFVATFIGRSNILDGELVLESGSWVVVLQNGYRIEIGNVRKTPTDSRQPVKVSIRPEEFRIGMDGQDALKGTVDDCVFLGLNTHYFVQLETGEKAIVIQESSVDEEAQPGATVHLSIKREMINVFSQDGLVNLLK